MRQHKQDGQHEGQEHEDCPHVRYDAPRGFADTSSEIGGICRHCAKSIGFTGFWNVYAQAALLTRPTAARFRYNFGCHECPSIHGEGHQNYHFPTLPDKMKTFAH
jgi:hypothetical protein